MPIVVIGGLAGLVAVAALRFAKAMRPWVAFAFVEYLACATAQIYYSRGVVEGGDTLYYARTGAVLARFLDNSFRWAAPEMLSLLAQQPSAFDSLVEGAGSNTGSMCAISAWLIFAFAGSQHAAHYFVAGLALLGALAIYRAFRDAYAELPPVRLFVATVLFPSVAFWTAALHKEAFCLMGMGLVLSAWRQLYRSWFRAALYAAPGLVIILVFRPPVIPPLGLGIVIYLVIERLQRKRGVAAIVLAPIYLLLALAALAVVMVVVSRFAPRLGLDQLGETIASKQEGWTIMRNVGGSALGGANEGAPQSLGAQIVGLPVALVNALFRPQLFDVHNFGAAASAVEMTTITAMILAALRYNGIRGVVMRIQRSPFLLMCAVVTVVGCAFVGLVTRNLGTLARYRVPFLPFYGALVMAIAQRATQFVAKPSRLNVRLRRHRSRMQQPPVEQAR